MSRTSSVTPVRSVCPHSQGRRPHFCDFAENIRLALDTLQMRIALAAVVVDAIAAKVLFIFHQQLDRLAAALRVADRLAQNFRRPFPSIDGEQFHVLGNPRLARPRPGNYDANRVAAVASWIMHDHSYG